MVQIGPPEGLIRFALSRDSTLHRTIQALLLPRELPSPMPQTSEASRIVRSAITPHVKSSYNWITFEDSDPFPDQGSQACEVAN
eukprot:s147_g15.t1